MKPGARKRLFLIGLPLGLLLTFAFMVAFDIFIVRAQRWCAQSDPTRAEACRNVAILGKGSLPSHITESFAGSACRNGDSDGCVLLAGIRLNLDVPPSKEQEEAIMKIGCELGNAEYCYFFGMRLEERGHEKEAEPHLKFACEKGQARACVILGINYSVKKDYERSIPYFKSACVDGVKEACDLLKAVLDRIPAVSTTK